MFMKSILTTAFIFVMGFSLFAQRNHVENPDFEFLEKKIKGAGGLEHAFGWSAVGPNYADIFNAKAKDEAYQVPLNVYGDAEPLSGETYAGFVTYSAKDAEPRTFLQNELKYTLEEGKVYCVKMNIMLSMLTKYASNNIGIYISQKPLKMEEIESGEIQPQIIHSQNQIWTEQFEWSAICGSFIAEGKERYITIGNFGSTAETQIEKIKRPRGVTGQQTRSTAYYYIDDVSVINMAGLDDCDCEKAPDGNSMQVKYSKEVSTDADIDGPEQIEMTKVYFEEMSSDISSRAMVDVEKVAAMIKNNPDLKIQIKGHTDPVEQAKSSGDISLLRAQTIKEKLVELGVNTNKLQVLGMKDFDPATDDTSVTGQAQNRRVVFDILD
jgi:outer membrane protein OmpA-like peptidoglycan-associated protein